jgi:Protein of unknown function (DUF3189).
VRLFYYDNGGSYSSIIAAYIHLQKLPEDRIPSINEIVKILEEHPGDFGVPNFVGNDLWNNQVYIIGFDSDSGLALQTIGHFLSKQDISFLKWHFVDTLDSTNLFIKTGGFISHIHSKSGKYLAAIGIQKGYFQLVQLVKSSQTYI